jgi:hypothetical protein
MPTVCPRSTRQPGLTKARRRDGEVEAVNGNSACSIAPAHCWQTRLYDLAAQTREVWQVISALCKTEGAGKTGCALHPRSRVQIPVEETHTSIQVQRKHSGLPCAVVLRLTSCSPRRSGFLVTVAPEKLASQELDAGVEASGPHDFAVRLSLRSSVAALASTASRPAFVTIASRPSVWDGMDVI